MTGVQAPPGPPALALERGELADVLGLLDEQVEEPGADLVARARSVARRLPPRLLEFLDAARLGERAGGFVVTGFPVDDAAIGPTPTDWRDAAARPGTREPERYLLALATVLGEVFAFRALQGGRLVQDLLPMPGHEQEKSGTSSASLLDLHSEDAFHPHRCDWLGLMCLRNDDGVGTSLSELAPGALPDEVVDVLFQPRYVIEPDPTHPLVPDPEPVALLWGDRRRPYLRVDDHFTHPLPGDGEAAAALAELAAALGAAERSVVLAPGEVLFVDNHLAVHGRRPFRARYDGRDRWLKRVSVTRDLRPSRTYRKEADGRVLD